jgi:hypothetical protein
VGEAAEGERKEEAVTDREQTPEEIREFFSACTPGVTTIGIDLRDGRHLGGVFHVFYGRTLRIERTFGRPAYTMFGGPRPPGPVVEIEIDEIVGVMIEIVIEDHLAATSEPSPRPPDHALQPRGEAVLHRP